MDNLTHTLAGFALARAGLDRTTRFGTTALVLGSNLPDADLLWSLSGDIAYLHYHRGITHSLAGALLQALLLWLTLDLWGRWRSRRAGRPLPRRPYLLLACVLGVASHLLLDASNSYGVRPLLPWSRAWWYGDLWVIVDPWLWLVLGGAMFLSREGRRLSLWFWSAAALLATALMASAPITAAMARLGTALSIRELAGLDRSLPDPLASIPLEAQVAWLPAVAVVVLLRWYSPSGGWRQKPARVGLLVIALYAIGCSAARSLVASRVEASLGAGLAGTEVAVLPRAADPLRWDVVVSQDGQLHRSALGVVPRFDPPSGYSRSCETRDGDPLVRRVLDTCGGRVLDEFLRFPCASIERGADGRRQVVFRDLRYASQRSSSRFGSYEVPLDARGEPVDDALPCPLWDGPADSR